MTCFPRSEEFSDFRFSHHSADFPSVVLRSLIFGFSVLSDRCLPSSLSQCQPAIARPTLILSNQNQQRNSAVTALSDQSNQLQMIVRASPSSDKYPGNCDPHRIYSTDMAPREIKTSSPTLKLPNWYPPQDTLYLLCSISKLSSSSLAYIQYQFLHHEFMIDPLDARWQKMGEVNIQNTTLKHKILNLRGEIERISSWASLSSWSARHLLLPLTIQWLASPI